MHDIKVERKESGSAELDIDKLSVVTVCGEPYVLKPGDKLIFSVRQDETLEILCTGEGKLSVESTEMHKYEQKHARGIQDTCVQMPGSAEAKTPECGQDAQETTQTPECAEDRPQSFEIYSPAPSKQKATAQDLKLAYKIALTRFRGSTLIVRSLRGVWFDRAMQRGIARIENAYLPYILVLLGLMVIGLAGAGKIENNILFALMGAWIIAAVFIIVPLMFFAVLPKPIAEHMKRIDELEGEDRRLYEEDLNENKRVNKIIKRYTMVDRSNERKRK